MILAWLYNGTGGSLPVVILFHAAGNTAVQLLLPEFTGGYYVLSFWALAAVNIAVVVALVRYVGPDLTENRVERPREGANAGEVRRRGAGLPS